eukprot:TRINITY_DN11254_c0_g1_i1.p1 TRINITY_DN11254_c0_g1~~TRINITY_DN11254_c0_g1_i1.p1  ORF type:complete len:167 (+),score=25.11 TRINITY_DN11254_c0_g1_i1:65-565(+)
MCIRDRTKSLATRLEDISLEFRKKQQTLLNHLQALRNRGLLAENTQISDKKEKVESKDRVMEIELRHLEDTVANRDGDINTVLQSMTQLSGMMKAISRIVIEQGTVLDRIDFNIETGYKNVKAGRGQLIKAHERKLKSSRRANYLIVFEIAMILFFSICLWLKYSH